MAQQGNDHTSDGLGDRSRPSDNDTYLNRLNQVNEPSDLKSDVLEVRLTKASKKLAQVIAYPPDGTYPANIVHTVAAIESWAEALLENHRWTEQPQRHWLRQISLDVIKIVEGERECATNDYAEGIHRLEKQSKKI